MYDAFDDDGFDDADDVIYEDLWEQHDPFPMLYPYEDLDFHVEPLAPPEPTESGHQAARGYARALSDIKHLRREARLDGATGIVRFVKKRMRRASRRASRSVVNIVTRETCE